MSLKRQIAHILPTRASIDTAEDTAVWTASTDVSGLATSTNHKQGSQSISFDKSGTSEAFGQLSRTFDADHQLDINDFSPQGKLKFWIYLSALTDVANVQLILGEDASNNHVYQVADSELTSGWNEVEFSINAPTSTAGNGAAWGSIGYVAVKVNLDGAGNTLSGILIDAIVAEYELAINVENLNISGTDLATATKQDAQTALLTTIDADTGAISTAASAIQTSSAATQALLDAISNVINGDANLVIDTEITTAIVNVGAGATTEVITAPGANKQIWVYGALLMADVAGTIALTQNGSPLTGVQPVGDNGGFSLPLSNNYKFPWIKLPSNEGLDVTTVTCTADGIIAYAIIDVS